MTRWQDIVWNEPEWGEVVDRAYDKWSDESVERELRAQASIDEWQALPWWKRLWYWVVG